MIENFFSNNWTIGIIGGIISGIIVYIITDRIFSKRENKEYIQKLKIANNELLYNVRPLVVEEHKPTIEILNSIINATARKYGVKKEDLYNKEDLADELIKEIVGNPFLTSENKLQYSNLCLEISNLNPSKSEIENDKKIIYITRSKDISKETLTLTLATVTALTFTLFTKIFKEDLITDDFKFDQIISIIPILISIPIISVMISKILQTIKRKKLEEQSEILKKSIEKMSTRYSKNKENN